MPKAFGLKELKKGYYPHFFNTEENQDYVGAYPEAKFYGPERMKTEERAKFLKWHEQKSKSGEVFNNAQELEAYCVSDVQILRESCLKFRDLFHAETNVDPFLEGNTIASACSVVFRQNFLAEDTIAIIPEGGYRRQEKQSVIALKWLMWIEKTENVAVQHKLTGGEKKLGQFRVDGYIERTNQPPVILEFHGCAWHGCPKCIKNPSKILPNQMSAKECYLKTKAREEALKQHGQVRVLWGVPTETRAEN